MDVSRRFALILLGGAAASLLDTGTVTAQPLPNVTVMKDPNCSCCSAWTDHLRQAGFPVTVVDTADLKTLKARLGVPDDLAACHTAQVGRYVIEGHVPASAVRRLLAEAPDATGLAVPDMPAGSPGMGGVPEAYEVTLFAPTARRSFGRYIGAVLAD